MKKTGKHGYLDEIFESKNQYEQFKETIYDVSDKIINTLYRVAGEDEGTVGRLLWRCGIYDMIKELSKLKQQPSTCAYHDAIDEKIERQIKDLRYLLKILEKLELDFIFI